MCINLAMILVSIYRWFSNSKYIVKFHSFHIMFSFYFQGWTIFILKMLKTDKNEPFKGIRVNYKFSNLDVNRKFWKLLCENVIFTLNTVTGCSKLIGPSWRCRCPSNLSCEEEALQGKVISCWNCLDTGICLAHICHNPDLSHTSHNLCWTGMGIRSWSGSWWAGPWRSRPGPSSVMSRAWASRSTSCSASRSSTSWSGSGSSWRVGSWSWRSPGRWRGSAVRTHFSLFKFALSWTVQFTIDNNLL